MLKACLSFLVVLLVISAPARAQDMFKSTTDNPLLKQTIHEFENICVQFVLHEREVSFEQDRESYQNHVKLFGFQERPLTEMERTNQQMADPSPRNIFLKSNPNKILTMYWDWSWNRDYWNAPSKTPGRWCRLSTKLPASIPMSHIETHILDKDSDWVQNSTNFSNQTKGEIKSKSQCVSFDGDEFLVSVSYNSPAYISAFSLFTENGYKFQNSNEDWVLVDDPSLSGMMLNLMINRASEYCGQLNARPIPKTRR